MVNFSEVEQAIVNMLEDLRAAQAAHSNGFNIDGQLEALSNQHDMQLEDLKSINFEA